MNIYHSTMVRRWHTNAALSHTNDPVGYHSGRMAVLSLVLWPGRSDLVAGCLTHDLGEVASGDIPWGGDKTTADAVADTWSYYYELDYHLDLNHNDTNRLKFLDRLDAYLWARHHAPHIMSQPDWRDQYEWLVDQSSQLGVYDKCIKLLQ